MLYNNIIVFDMETGGRNPRECECIQIAAVVINPRTLELFKQPNGKPVHFNSLMRPTDFDKLEEGALRVNKKTVEELEEAPLPEVVWNQFATFCKQYALGGKSDSWSAPIAGGFNIINFDMVILQRLCETYGMTGKEGKQSIFHTNYYFDLMQLIAYWFNGQKDPTKYNFDALRDFFGLSKEGAHDALQDVLDTAAVLRRFMNLARTLQEPDAKWRVKFKDAFKKTD